MIKKKNLLLIKIDILNKGKQTHNKTLKIKLKNGLIKKKNKLSLLDLIIKRDNNPNA